MEVSLLKIIVNNLWLEVGKKEYPETLKESINSFLASLDHYPKTKVDLSLILSLRKLIDGFWQWWTDTHPPMNWLGDIEVAPWLGFQRVLVRHDILVPDYHHDICFKRLRHLYQDIDQPLPLDNVLITLTKICQQLSATEFSEGDNEYGDYPAKIIEQIEENGSPAKLTRIVTRMALLFNLFYYHMDAKQTVLLRHMITYRALSAFNDRYAERWLLDYLLTNPVGRLGFFERCDRYIDYSEVERDENLQEMMPYIPKTQQRLNYQLSLDRWYFGVLKLSSELNGRQKLESMVCMLHNDFAHQPMLNFQAMLDFSDLVLKQKYLVDQRHWRDLLLAVKIFRLEQYCIYRENAKEDSSIPFSKMIKCSFAEDEIKRLKGLRETKPTLWQWFASRQGHLGQITSMNDDCSRLIYSEPQG